jgi:glutamyl-Q tRNA(Asp) synthetase
MTAQGVIPGQVRVVTRFAPSPTGRLHLGHALSAIRAHDFARAAGGTFLLRIEDIDATRSRADHIDAILADLRWLGLAWDGAVLRQSERLSIYADALDRLRAAALVYPCFCTRAEIAASVAAPHGEVAPRYPGTCRGIAAPDLSRPHCWRLDMARAIAAAGPLDWTDHGVTIAAEVAVQGDVVLARKDAPASYHLAVTVDDAEQGVTDIVRGVDLFAATHVHRLLQSLLALPTPRYHHHPLVTDPDGTRLAKRTGAPTLESMRLAGQDGAGLAARLRAEFAISSDHPPASS